MSSKILKYQKKTRCFAHQNIQQKPLPIKKSYGIICARFNKRTNKIEFLLVRKRCTYYYFDFILKHYDKYDDTKLLYLFNRMTYDEKIDILSLDFGRMWFRLWLINPDSPYTPPNLKLSTDYDRYKLCKSTFEKNYMYDGGKRLRDIMGKSKNSNCLWEIPKGRKSSSQEKDMVTAIREFGEETGIDSLKYDILEEGPIILSNISNGVKYTNYYYLAIYTDPDINVNIDFNNQMQISEISGIDWFDIDKINVLDSPQIVHVIKNANKILRKKYKIQKLFELDLLNIKNTINYN